VDLNQPGAMENVELTCHDSIHQLADLGEQEKVCQSKEAAWKDAKEEAASAKKEFEAATEALRALVRRATGPSNTPLLDASDAPNDSLDTGFPAHEDVAVEELADAERDGI